MATYVEIASTPDFQQADHEKRRTILSNSSPVFKSMDRGSQDRFITGLVDYVPKQKPWGVDRATQDLKSGWSQGWGHAEHTLGNVLSVVPGDIGKYGKHLQEDSKNVVAPAGNTVADQMISGVGMVIPQATEYAPALLLKNKAPLGAAVIGALGAADKGTAEAAKTGLSDAVSWSLMGDAAKIKNPVIRAAAGGLGSAAPKYISSGGNAEGATASFLLGGAISLLGHGSPKEENKISTPELIKKAKEQLRVPKEVNNTIREQLAPHTLGEHESIMGRSIRENNAYVHKATAQANYALKKESRIIGRLPQEQSDNFVQAIQTNTVKTLPEILQGVAAKYREVFDPWQNWLLDKRYLEYFNEGYFGDLLKDPKRVGEINFGTYAGKRPLPGTAGYLKKRKYLTLKDVRNAHLTTDENGNPILDKNGQVQPRMITRKDPATGQTSTEPMKRLETITDNPIDWVILNIRNIARFKMAHDVAEEMLQKGIVKWVPSLKGFKQPNPETWKIYPGMEKLGYYRYMKMAKVGKGPLIHDNYTLEEGEEPEDFPDATGLSTEWALPHHGDGKTPGSLLFSRNEEGAPGKLVPGNLYIMKQAARPLDNFLSNGLRNYVLYRGIDWWNRSLNLFQLGFSAFHAGFTSIDSATGQFAIGIERAIEGARSGDAKMAGKGLIKAATSPIAPVANVIKGRKLMKEGLAPGSHPELKDIAHYWDLGGGRWGMDPIYETHFTENMQRAFDEDKVLKGTMAAIGVPPEFLGNLIMKHYVPYQKLGMFAEMMQFEIEKNGLMDHDQMREAAARAVDSVDNRMGQLVYDNLHWNRVVKDLSHLVMRSVGWNLGTFRELLGGVADYGTAVKGLSKEALNLAKSGDLKTFFDNIRDNRKIEFTHRMAYVAAMPVFVGLLGSMIGYMYRQPPRELKDYFYPRTGRKDEYGRDERIAIPSYMKDVYGAAFAVKDGFQGIEKFISSKAAPWIWMGAEMVDNHDFFNTQIRNEDDPLLKQIMDTLSFGIGEFAPISGRNLVENEKRNASRGTQAAAFFGFTPATQEVKKSAAENLASKYSQGNISKQAHTQESADKKQYIDQIERYIRTNQDPTELIAEGKAKGLISNKDVVTARKNSSIPPLVRSFKNLPIDQAVKVMDVATPEERALLMRMFKAKYYHNREKILMMPPDRRRKYLDIITNVTDGEIQVTQ